MNRLSLALLLLISLATLTAGQFDYYDDDYVSFIEITGIIIIFNVPQENLYTMQMLRTCKDFYNDLTPKAPEMVCPQCVCSCPKCPKCELTSREEEKILFRKILNALEERSYTTYDNLEVILDRISQAVAETAELRSTQFGESYCLANFPPMPPKKTTCRSIWPCRRPRFPDCTRYFSACREDEIKKEVRRLKTDNDAKEFYMNRLIIENRRLNKEIDAKKDEFCM